MHFNILKLGVTKYLTYDHRPFTAAEALILPSASIRKFTVSGAMLSLSNCVSEKYLFLIRVQ